MVGRRDSRIRQIAIGVAVAMVLQGAFAVSAFGRELVLFSSVSGVVVDGGQPVAGATVKRKWQWSEERGEDEVVTDAAGEFSFPEHTTRSLLWSVFPHSPGIFQTISIEVEGKTYDAWDFKKGNYRRNGEADGRPLRMRCDLQSRAREHDITELSSYFGICELE